MEGISEAITTLGVEDDSERAVGSFDVCGAFVKSKPIDILKNGFLV